MTDPIKLYRDLTCNARPEPLKNILGTVLSNYLQAHALSPAIRNELERYRNYIVDAPLGTLVSGFRFATVMPKQITELLGLIALREHSQLTAVLPLLANCENVIAASSMNARVIYEQACLLETALNQNNLTPNHVEQIETKLDHLIDILYQKFAELIVNASSEDEIVTLTSSHFPSELGSNLESIDYFLGEVGGQLDYLSSTSFFEKFIAEPSLAQKLDFVERYHTWAEGQQAFSDELNLTLEFIASILVNKAYQSCKAKRQRLIDDPTLTVPEVNQQLTSWANRAWKKHANSYLLDDLKELLAQDQKTLDDWNTYDLHSQESAQPMLQPAYTIAAIRFTLATPDINPAELLASIAPAVPPQRPESARARRDEVEVNHQGKRPRSNSL